MCIHSHTLERSMARFLSRVVEMMVRNLEALKTRLVKPYDLRLHPQPFYTF